MAKKLVYGMFSPSWLSFKKMKNHLRWVSRLDVDIIHLSPFFPSSTNDGYAVTNYMNVDPRYGSIDDFDDLVDAIHHKNMKVFIELPINCTSVRHPWFDEAPDRYIRRRYAPGEWGNLAGGSAWGYDEELQDYYLQLLGSETADLKWFIADEYIKQSLVEEFRSIVSYWYYYHGVDGFYIGVPQAINKSGNEPKLKMVDFYLGYKAVRVINSIFDWTDQPSQVDRPGLIVEISDPTHGALVDFYARETGADLVMDIGLKNELKKDFNLGWLNGYGEHFLFSLEENHSPRFENDEVTPDKVIWEIFRSETQNIYLHQGQELGVLNPEQIILSDEQIFELDWIAKDIFERFCRDTKNYQDRSEMMAKIRKVSRANSRIALPENAYRRQLWSVNSVYNLTRSSINKWRKDQ